jgi:hypothetical protein
MIANTTSVAATHFPRLLPWFARVIEDPIVTCRA